MLLRHVLPPTPPFLCLQDDGLRLSNSWEGFYVLLNPDYSAQTQWRFVNRAIDEVENDKVRCRAAPAGAAQRMIRHFLDHPRVCGGRNASPALATPAAARRRQLSCRPPAARATSA